MDLPIIPLIRRSRKSIWFFIFLKFGLARFFILTKDSSVIDIFFSSQQYMLY